MSQFQKFVAGMSESISPKVDSFPVAASTTIAKGDVIFESGGFMVIATVALNAQTRHAWVSIEIADNSVGANGDIGVLCVGAGQRVTVQTTDALTPGTGIKVSTTDGKIQNFVEGTDDINLRIGFFVGIEPGVYFKDTAAPFAEGYTTDSDPEVAAVANDIVVVELE